jgi:NADPH-dependent ferric siderophore reductase
MARNHEDVCWEKVTGAVLLAGDCHSISEMQAVARRLGPDTHATMLVEAFSRVQVYRVKVPAHVSVIWLVRDRESFDSSPCGVRTRGQRLATAIYAWCAEWACTTGPATADCTVWLASRMPPHIVRMTRSLLDAAREHPGARRAGYSALQHADDERRPREGSL